MIIFFLRYFLFLLVLPMMNVLKKNIHSFFGLSGTLDPSTTTAVKFRPHSHGHRVSSFSGGLGLIAAAKDGNELPYVLESARVKPTAKREIGGVEEEEVVDGLASCTESLGFESSDERRADDPIEEIKEMINHNNRDDINDGVCWQKIKHHKEEKRFPPPLTSLNMNGQPCFFLRPVRKDGRLELTEVRIHRHEIIHASRQDGRLRIHLIPDDDPDDEDEEEELGQLQEEEGEEALVHEEEMREAITNERSEEEEWKRAMGSSEGVRRCHEVVNHGGHHHHHHHQLQICGVSIM